MIPYHDNAARRQGWNRVFIPVPACIPAFYGYIIANLLFFAAQAGRKEHNQEPEKFFMTETMKTADLAEVIADLEKEVGEKPENIMARHQLGLVYRQAGRIDEAIAALEKVIEKDNQSMESMINLGAIFFERGDTDRALELNQRALKVSPKMAEAHVNIGLIRQHRNEVNEAIASYTTAVQIDPRLITAWINLTSAYTMLEEDDKAVEAARQAVTLEPDSPMARNNLAVALYFKGQFKEAKRNLDKARELGYSVDPRFVEALEGKLTETDGQ
jgi:tetratricopeptide (TPR) repeat protein